jgi:hypothetical protein
MKRLGCRGQNKGVRDAGVIDSGHGREKGEGGEENVRVEVVGGRRGRDQPTTGAQNAQEAEAVAAGGRGDELEARGGVQATNKAREGGVDVLDEAAEALNLNDGEGCPADGVRVTHPPERERRGGAQGGVEEGGALRQDVGGDGRKRNAEEGEGGVRDVPHEGEGEGGVCAEEALQGLRRGEVQPPHVRPSPRDRQP